jgi:hypothetical protein
MDFTFTLEGELGRRAAYRERVRGLTARIEETGESYVVHDVSASGLAVVDPEERLASGLACRLTMAIAQKDLVSGLPATVVRVTGRGLTGLAFGQLSLRQEAWLDKLVLEIQKRRINLRKSRQPAENIDKKKTDSADEQT